MPLLIFDGAEVLPKAVGMTIHDSFLVLCEEMTLSQVEGIAATVAAMNNDWVEIFGFGSEAMHDSIDRASVAAGRQAAVGDGKPMTGWNDTVLDPDKFIDYIGNTSLGCQSAKVVFVFGSAPYFEALISLNVD